MPLTLPNDADGMMVQRTENGQTINRVGKLFEHNTTLGSFTKHYLFGGKLIAMREGLTANSAVSFFATDHLGSTSATLWGNGSLRSRLRYDPWGKERYAQYATPSGYRYTSQCWDSGLGLYDYNARYYDPTLGKFISADTLVPEQKRLTPLTVAFHENQFLEKVNQENGQITQFGPISSWDAQQKKEFGVSDGSLAPQNLNRLAYAANNPQIFVDPDGHLPVLLIPLLVGGAIGGTISTVAYVTAARLTGQEVTVAGTLGAFAGGAVAGAISVIATPLAGTLLHAVGATASGTALVASTAAVNAAGGTVSYLAGGYTQNAVDTALGNESTFQPTAGGAVTNAVVAGALSPAVSSRFPVDANTMSTLKQANHFMPGRTFGTLFATSNSRNLYAQSAVATGVGAYAGNGYTLWEEIR